MFLLYTAFRTTSSLSALSSMSCANSVIAPSSHSFGGEELFEDPQDNSQGSVIVEVDDNISQEELIDLNIISPATVVAVMKLFLVLHHLLVPPIRQQGMDENVHQAGKTMDFLTR